MANFTMKAIFNENFPYNLSLWFLYLTQYQNTSFSMYKLLPPYIQNTMLQKKT